MHVGELGAEQLTGADTRELLGVVDDEVAAVVPLARVASEYLFVSTEPWASRTAGDAKFSDAMSWTVVFCRSSSRAMTPAISGSVRSNGDVIATP